MSLPCDTKICNGVVKPLSHSKWLSNQYCKYVAALCKSCMMTYWIVERKNRLYLKDRKGSHHFDQRKTNRI